jgi:hypothetical protein
MTCAWVAEFSRAVCRPENQDTDQIGSGSKHIKPAGERRERQLTLDLLLLRLEGRVCGLSRPLQVKDHSILLLSRLALILIGYAQLGQLPIELRDFLVPELEGRMCLLKRGALLLELALRFLPRHVFVLKGGLGLPVGGLLLLEQGLCRLAHAQFLLELLPRRGERGELVR